MTNKLTYTFKVNKPEFVPQNAKINNKGNGTITYKRVNKQQPTLTLTPTPILSKENVLLANKFNTAKKTNSVKSWFRLFDTMKAKKHNSVSLPSKSNLNKKNNSVSLPSKSNFKVPTKFHGIKFSKCELIDRDSMNSKGIPSNIPFQKIYACVK